MGSGVPGRSRAPVGRVLHHRRVHDHLAVVHIGVAIAELRVRPERDPVRPPTSAPPAGGPPPRHQAKPGHLVGKVIVGLAAVVDGGSIGVPGGGCLGLGGAPVPRHQLLGVGRPVQAVDVERAVKWAESG